ncbi:MAG: hypothetical protein JWM14_1407 [Chitinophagaceae bacterium]|nr:hypothetical protein [Chitinophagaceae bacterium]
MKTGKILFYLMIVVYTAVGLIHLLFPERFLWIMPQWMPHPLLLIYLSGVAEIILAMLLIPEKTRKISAWLIIAMLIVYFFIIHGTQSVDFYKTGNKYFLLTVIRLVFQFILIRWAWLYTRTRKSSLHKK